MLEYIVMQLLFKFFEADGDGLEGEYLDSSTVLLRRAIGSFPSLPIKSNQIKSNQIKSNQIKSNQIKSNQIKPKQTKSNQTKQNQTKQTTESQFLAVALYELDTSALKTIYRAIEKKHEALSEQNKVT